MHTLFLQRSIVLDHKAKVQYSL